MKTNTHKNLARAVIAIIVMSYASFALAVDPPVCTSPGVPHGCKPAKPTSDGDRTPK